MARPSDAVLRWLRAQLDARGMNTATVARKLERPRGDTRKMLTGVDPMTVDDLLRITELLELSPEQMGLPAGADVDALEEAMGAQKQEAPQWRNQPRALAELGFSLGIDFRLFVDSKQLVGWGGPEHVVARYEGRVMPLQLDAAYHHYMEPRFEDEALSVVLVFDDNQLYRCAIPWTAIGQVLFTPFPPEQPEPEAEAEEEPPPSGAPFLRLVT